jgi:hypothetical protein
MLMMDDSFSTWEWKLFAVYRNGNFKLVRNIALFFQMTALFKQINNIRCRLSHRDRGADMSRWCDNASQVQWRWFLHLWCE